MNSPHIRTAAIVSALELLACKLLAPRARPLFEPMHSPLTHPYNLRSQGPGKLELDQIAPNYALRQNMEAWIAGHESQSFA